jgi:hypothetical protein
MVEVACAKLVVRINTRPKSPLLSLTSLSLFRLPNFKRRSLSKGSNKRIGFALFNLYELFRVKLINERIESFDALNRLKHAYAFRLGYVGQFEADATLEL